MRLAEPGHGVVGMPGAVQVLAELEAGGRARDLRRARSRARHDLVGSEREPAVGAVLDPVAQRGRRSAAGRSASSPPPAASRRSAAAPRRAGPAPRSRRGPGRPARAGARSCPARRSRRRVGTFTTPSSSSSRCASSISAGCSGLARSIHGPAASRAADVERDRHDLEALRVQLGSQFLPHGQVEAASSPRGPRDEQDLLAVQRGQRERVPVRDRAASRRAARPTAARARRTPGRAPTARAPRRGRAPCRAARRARATSSRSPPSSGSGTQRSALHAPSGLISQPVRARSSSGVTSRRSRITRAIVRQRKGPGTSRALLRTANRERRFLHHVRHPTAGHAHRAPSRGSPRPRTRW